MMLFLNILERPVPSEGQPVDPDLRKSWGWWKVKKWTVHILNRLYTRYVEVWINLYNSYKQFCCMTDSEFLWLFKLPRDSFGDLKLQNPENRAFAQMFQKHYAGKILECHLNLLNVIRVGGYLPDRVINLILQYLSNRWVYFEVSFCIIDSIQSNPLFLRVKLGKGRYTVFVFVCGGWGGLRGCLCPFICICVLLDFH